MAEPSLQSASASDLTSRDTPSRNADTRPSRDRATLYRFVTRATSGNHADNPGILGWIRDDSSRLFKYKVMFRWNSVSITTEESMCLWEVTSSRSREEGTFRRWSTGHNHWLDHVPQQRRRHDLSVLEPSCTMAHRSCRNFKVLLKVAEEQESYADGG